VANPHRFSSRPPRPTPASAPAPAPEGFGRVKKKLLPGSNGTKRHQLRYGSDLVCVRYREDTVNNVQYTTVEVVVDQRPLKKERAKPFHPSGDEIVLINMNFQEGCRRLLGIEYGANWNSARQLWEMPYATAEQLNLQNWVLPRNG
jgi:hypothetical protein